MDAKPQRPPRSLHIRADENIPPAGLGSHKTIHHRNKSSPALSTSASMGNTKLLGLRTAFGDVSNTANSNRLAHVKDDLAYPAKTKGHIPEKPTNIPVQQEKRILAPLSRPAQRPISASLKGLLTGSSSVKDTEPATKVTPAIDAQSAAPIAANSRKVLTKRSTTIFKDTIVSTVTEIPSLHDRNLQSAAALPSVSVPDHQPSNVSQQSSKSALKEISQESLRSTTTAPEGQPVEITDLPSIGNAEDQKRSSLETVESEEPQTFHDSLPVQGVDDLNFNGGLPAEVNSLFHSVPPPPAMPGAPVETVSTRYSHPSIPEAEEYWDDEENVEDDGYVTAHSYRSKGDNTTGGATILPFPQVTKQVKKELAAAKELVESSRTAEEIEDECYDTSMVAEYGDEIFDYMRKLEIKMLPNAHYMDNQAEIQWSMRSVLIDWVVQVHLRFNLLPETLFLTINYIDRFLSSKIVSLGKLQLVGATALFIAAKYEEINCPSVQEIVYMVDGGYTTDEVLKAERFMLSMLQFELGFPGPMSFLRRISKADDYDLETRTLAKYFLEVTIMDERFIASPASFVAAGSHCLARLMLRKGSWGPSHVYYSGYTYSQLLPLLVLMVECCECPRRHHGSVYNKYCDKRFKRASTFVETEMANGFRLPVSQKELSSPHVVEYFDQVPWRRVN